MGRIIIAAFVATMALIGRTDPAQAGPWCVVEQSVAGDGATNCGFVTWEQCRETAIGNRGFCAPNPADPPRAFGPERKRRKAYRSRH